MSSIKPWTMFALALMLAWSPLTKADSANSAHQEAPMRLFVTVTGQSPQARAMPLVLANQALDQGAVVRVLLCGQGAELALKNYEATRLGPRDVTAKQLLANLMSKGALVEVCAIFLPNTPHTREDLTEGIGVAKPADVAAWMLQPNTRLFTH